MKNIFRVRISSTIKGLFYSEIKAGERQGRGANLLYTIKKRISSKKISKGHSHTTIYVRSFGHLLRAAGLVTIRILFEIHFLYFTRVAIWITCAHRFASTWPQSSRSNHLISWATTRCSIIGMTKNNVAQVIESRYSTTMMGKKFQVHQRHFHIYLLFSIVNRCY